MNWKELLSEKRWSSEVSAGKRDLRSEIGKDYHRIIESASFRRLQDKTQVFPLDKSDFIRTRLTHSLEVSSIGRSLAQNIGESIISQKLDPHFTPVEKDKLTEVLECAGLIHDIGNPPFGHFGEETIRDWFCQTLPVLTYQGQPLTDYLTEEQQADFYHFEGNAQDLRLVTKLHYPIHHFGLNLTAATLSAIIKYPNSSLEIDISSKNIQQQKMGYMTSEQAQFDWIQHVTGTHCRRSPVAFILEAADDIAYATADIEDAFKKGFFNYDTLLREFSERGLKKSSIQTLKTQYDLARLSGSVDADEYAIRSWLSEIQDELIYAATDAFLSDYTAIMAGSRQTELLHHTSSRRMLSVLKQVAYDYAFTSESIYRTEIAAHSILTYLLDCLIPAALTYGTNEKPGLMDDKYLSLIPEHYKQVFQFETKDLPEREKIYYRLLLACDSVSGMTDSHARDLYAELKGFTSLFI